ncbi:hypothetical protein [Asaccharospora irregularis]|uniref:Uncharacterized protein n=1 Tax=Asaccharospora irregularis DSM 2635 TaxID=1121321 RepID=A0A1M5JEI6_9FIRM|nr:hypothetical protein [Asaccharospora irregularis]SHG38679.1 hypothetical protein SAMN04488530_10196 [Asaccharospora irregularis DSM 2635]
MELIDTVSIDSLSKRDLLLIIKSLEYANKDTNIQDFIDLRNSIVKELCFLTNTSEETFLNYLETNS